MCIRDRQGEWSTGVGRCNRRAWRAVGRARRRQSRLGLALRPGLGGNGQRFRPVSYTHLRAHETVLDLVCRLLLETKNIDGRIAAIQNILHG